MTLNDGFSIIDVSRARMTRARTHAHALYGDNRQSVIKRHWARSKAVAA
jgi:hypothetical protein